MNRANVLQFTTNSAIGGAESLVLSFLEKASRDKYNLHLSSLLSRGPLLEEAARSGIPTLELDADRRGYLAAFWRLRRFMAERRIHLVHLCGLKAELLGRLAARLTGVPVVISGVWGINTWRNRYQHWLDRSTSSLTDLYIANSEAARQEVIQRVGIPADKVIVIHNGIAFEQYNSRFDAGEKYGLDGAGPVVGTLAGLLPLKGHGDIIEAVPVIAARFPDVRFLFIGRDYMRGRLQRLVGERGLERYVTFTDFCPDVRPLLAVCDLFLLPSTSESAPVSILEAMAMRLPVVATRVGGVPELVLDGETGLLIPPRDPQALAEAVISLLENPARAGEMGRAGRRRVEQFFTLERMVAGIEEVYDRLLLAKNVVQ
jgi:glycosyltransferase involved in cell wall biosynthesis